MSEAATPVLQAAMAAPDPSSQRVESPARPLALDDFRLHDRHEILALLRDLAKARCPLTIDMRDGPPLVLTLFEVDAARNRLLLDARTRELGAATPMPPLPGAMAVGHHEHIRIQFPLSGCQWLSDAQGPALSADLPHEAWRFQRRAAVRVRPLHGDMPMVDIPWPRTPDQTPDETPDETPGLVRLQVLDVSLGGLALLWTAQMPAPRLGTWIDHVSVALDPQTRFVCSLRPLHLTASPQGERLGCEIRGLEGLALRQLQRYIFDTQRARRAIERGA